MGPVVLTTMQRRREGKGEEFDNLSWGITGDHG